MNSKLKILFLCTGNSCRSQMAEGFAKHFKNDVVEAYSAGVEPSVVNPLTTAVMKEVGIDISDQSSKHVDEFKDIEFDYVITLCDHARESCPLFLGKTKKVHKGFDDPLVLARDASTEEERLNHYRRVRDEVRDYILSLPGALDG